MRRGEILSFAWDQVDFSRRLIRIAQSKSGRFRAIPMNARVVAEMERLKARRDSEAYVFQSDRMDKHLGWLKRKWERAVREAKIPDFRFHDLRHTAATRFADCGADTFTIAAILGHATIQMSARYTHATDEGTRRAVERLIDFGNPGHKSVTKQKRQVG
jgi:integrase